MRTFRGVEQRKKLDTLMRLASGLLRDAQNLLAAGSLRSAMSRAYYAAYHACVDALERFGFAPEQFYERKDLPANRDADYFPMTEISLKRARKMAALAKELIATIQRVMT